MELETVSTILSVGFRVKHWAAFNTALNTDADARAPAR
jgi:hypothetical protein